MKTLTLNLKQPLPNSLLPLKQQETMPVTTTLRMRRARQLRTRRLKKKKRMRRRWMIPVSRLKISSW